MSDMVAELLDLLLWLGRALLVGLLLTSINRAWHWLHQRWSTWTESRHARHLTEQVGRDGLSDYEIGSFSNWTASSSTTACKLLVDLKEIGCNAIWHWNDPEQSWLRCSLKSDGNPAPGSVNFPIEQDMLIYLGG